MYTVDCIAQERHGDGTGRMPTQKSMVGGRELVESRWKPVNNLFIQANVLKMVLFSVILGRLRLLQKRL